MKKSLTYKDAGVNIDAANKLVETIKSLAKTSFRPEVLTEIGGFSGLFALNIEKYKRPVLTASTDGVGTKLKIALMLNKHDTVGIDLVAMCVNDIMVQGAEPLFLLDYIATGKVEHNTLEALVAGIARGCSEANCALIGGEVAEMPSFYNEGEYDVAGFVVGVVDQDKIIDGSEIRIGDKVVGIASSGLHSNGYSLVRKIVFEQLNLDLHQRIEELGRTLGEELLEPTKIYIKPLLNIISEFHVHGIAHITGGGVLENIPRILPDSCQVVIHRGSWIIPPIFTYLQEKGNIGDLEMLRTFNNGIGMVIIVPQEEAEDIIARLKNMHLQSYCIGEVAKRKAASEPMVLV